MHFEQLFFLLWALQCLGRWESNKNPVDPNAVLRGPCCGRLVITALLHEALWGLARGPHPRLMASPRLDLYDTGDMCEFDTNIYDIISLASHGTRLVSGNLGRWIWACTPMVYKIFTKTGWGPWLRGDCLTQKDNADSGVQFIGPAGPPLSQGPRAVFVKTLYSLSV